MNYSSETINKLYYGDRLINISVTNGGGGGDVPSNLSEWTYDDNGNITSMVYTAETIPNDAYHYGKLTDVTIGSGVTSIGNNAFAYCYSLTSIDIPNSVTSIGSRAFENCSSLTSVAIPSGVTSIGERTFNGCNRLTRLNSDVDGVFNLPSGVTSIGNMAFSSCISFTSINIPSGVTSIGRAAFQSCRLTSINLPSGVTRIDQNAFYGCSSLTSITVNATTPPTLGSSAFNNTNNCPIYVPSSSVDAYKAATNWRNYASRIQAIP